MTRDDILEYSSLATLIVGHARLPNIEKLIEETSKAGIRRIYLHLDLGFDIELVESQIRFCRDMENKFDGILNVKLTEKNMGIAKSVYSALEWFFSLEKSGVILEDDLVVTVNTFNFFRRAIPFLMVNERCLLVSGSTFLREDSTVARRDIGWTNLPLIWGWATTSDKWMKLKELIIQPVPRRWPVSRIGGFLSIGAFKALTGIVDTWDSPMALGMWSESYLCMIPPHNLVMNIGSDTVAIHTKTGEFPIGNPIKEFNISDINFVQPNPKAIRKTNTLIINQNYKLETRHMIAPLLINLQKKDQSYLRRKLIDER